MPKTKRYRSKKMRRGKMIPMAAHRPFGIISGLTGLASLIGSVAGAASGIKKLTEKKPKKKRSGRFV